MIEFFQNIAYFITTIVDGMITGFTYFPRFLASVTAGVNQTLSLFNQMPDFILHAGLLVLVVAVVFLILKVFHG